MSATDAEPARPDTYAALREPEIRLMLAAGAAAALANRALMVVVGFQVYAITKSPLMLGVLGLVEAVAVIATSLIGGYVADRASRRRIILRTRTAMAASALALAALSTAGDATNVWALLGVIFCAGVALGFHSPAMSAFEAQVVPAPLMLNASSWFSMVWQGASLLGPVAGGISYDLIGPVGTYLAVAGLQGVAILCTWAIAPKPKPEARPGESIFQSIGIGIRFVFQNQVLVGSMALDLFAVLFGGAIALLPIFATDILKVGATEFGVLSAAPALGSLLIMLWTTRRPPLKRAGRTLMFAIAGFGVAIIVFAFSQNFWLSFAALAASGACDGYSVVIRRVILRLYSPEHLRGRVAAVNRIFISASNELGAFESGMAAAAFGAVPAVWLGGLVTLGVVAATAVWAPKLRRLDLTDLSDGRR
jgi:MFS family permease